MNGNLTVTQLTTQLTLSPRLKGHDTSDGPLAEATEASAENVMGILECFLGSKILPEQACGDYLDIKDCLRSIFGSEDDRLMVNGNVA